MSRLELERKLSSLSSPRQLTFILDGGADQTDKKERFEKLLSENPVFRTSDKYTLSREDRYCRAMEKSRAVEVRLFNC
jgi:hypothetical protein